MMIIWPNSGFHYEGFGAPLPFLSGGTSTPIIVIAATPGTVTGSDAETHTVTSSTAPVYTATGSDAAVTEAS